MRFNDHDYAKFYDMHQTESGYPGKLLQPVIEALEGYKSVIDIGAGTGFFSIPLLESGHRITAVEPASEMSDFIIKKCPSVMKNRLTIINDEWENWKGEKHDSSICIHSLYPMKDRVKAIELMHEYSKKRIIVVREPSEMVTLSGQVRTILGLSLNRDFGNEIKSVLNGLKVDFEIKKIIEERVNRFSTIEQEVSSILYQLKLDSSFKEKVETIVRELCSADSSGFYFNSFYSDKIFIF